ncbi:uncharacterized protein LOC110976033 [Acanthaster planci]|uniref:Uncharacterized protein LOC110976033 n=1 Tax=Acanthaster planci TaxID=133434 RepID=A0A8B7XUY0_ACAPL|nr:uncharacterized protein LOC110976033 [Acanthaster planci]
MASPPPLLPMQVANSSLLGQALQAANDMGGLSALQLAVQQQQLQQQQQFLHAVQAAHAQNAGHKMMSPTPSNEQALTLNNQGASPPGDTDSRDEEKTALVNLMPPSSLASPVSIQQGDQADLHAMVPSSQMQTPISSQLLTTSTSSDNAYTMPATAAAAPLPSINMPAGMMAGTNHVSNLNMGLAPHLIQLNNPQASMPVPQMVIQPGGPAGQEMVSPEQMMVQGVANITNNNNIDMMSNMPTQCTSSSTKRRNSKRPVPDTEKDEKYFERRSRNNMAAKRSRDSRKRREDQVSMRANFLQKENDILRAQLATLRQEANSLKQLLTQQRPIMPAQMSMQMPTQLMPKNMPE